MQDENTKRIRDIDELRDKLNREKDDIREKLEQEKQELAMRC